MCIKSIKALFLLAIVLLPLVLISASSLQTEYDIELLESLSEEENDEKDCELDGLSDFSFNLSWDISGISEEDVIATVYKKHSDFLVYNLAFKVSTPPPELS